MRRRRLSKHRRSDTERHWDQVCLAVITVATAAIAATFLTTNPEEAAQNTDPWTLIINITIAAAAFGYLALTGVAIWTVARPKPMPTRTILQWKTNMANSVLAMFMALIMVLVVNASIPFITHALKSEPPPEANKEQSEDPLQTPSPPPRSSETTPQESLIETTPQHQEAQPTPGTTSAP